MYKDIEKHFGLDAAEAFSNLSLFADLKSHQKDDLSKTLSNIVQDNIGELWAAMLLLTEQIKELSKQ